MCNIHSTTDNYNTDIMDQTNVQCTILTLIYFFAFCSKNERLKVMREVRALATLVQDSHQNVVRYNTSWEERAPPNWKSREHWRLLDGSSEIM